ncbi:MAG: SH3 domain-containing protein, partial [Chloroflexota bacterium]|nr:SH3 domain-containing protein [Chloroflexota bacterium]
TAADSSATPATSLTASAPALASDGPSVEPSPSPSPTPAQAPVIANRSIVEVGPDALNLREQPSEDASVLAEMPPGRRLFVIGEPTDAGELRWYRVGVVSGPDCPEDCNLIGYVATPAAAEEDAWIGEVSIDCPSSPMTSQQLASLLPLEALHCYGRNDITVTGTVDTPCCTPPNPILLTPEWLAGPAPAYLRYDGNVNFAVEFRADPGAELEVPERGDVVQVVGHFEDPAATTCRAEIDEEFQADEPVQLPQPARVVLDCRATFVWTGYEVTGSEDLGPCCGALPGGSPTGSVKRRI